ncbi:MAG: hypothetical protein Fur0044_34940 [Anaerolineae bacterium]
MALLARIWKSKASIGGIYTQQFEAAAESNGSLNPAEKAIMGLLRQYLAEKET